MRSHLSASCVGTHLWKDDHKQESVSAVDVCGSIAAGLFGGRSYAERSRSLDGILTVGSLPVIGENYAMDIRIPSWSSPTSRHIGGSWVGQAGHSVLSLIERIGGGARLVARAMKVCIALGAEFRLVGVRGLMRAPACDDHERLICADEVVTAIAAKDAV
jgi:hypothetical protein